MYALLIGSAFLAQTAFAGENRAHIPDPLACGHYACAYYYHDKQNYRTAQDKANLGTPDLTEGLDSLQTRSEYREQYVVKVEAWVRAPWSGDYIFKSKSDDNSEVYVGPNPGSMDNLETVVTLDGCCRTEVGTKKIRFQKGEYYYVVGYMTEIYGRDYFEIGWKGPTVDENIIDSTGLANNYPTNEPTEWQPSGFAVVGVPVPKNGHCASSSENTENLLAKMDTAQKDFGECNKDIWKIAGTLSKVTTASSAVEKATEAMDTITEKIGDVVEKVAKHANVLGKIPKVGIFLKLGMKATDKVMDGIEPIADMVAKWGERINTAVEISEQTFKTLKVVSGPTQIYLAGSHKILEAAHNCAEAVGYCGSKATQMEAHNREKYPAAADELEKIALAGRTCHDILSPMDAVLRELAAVAEWIEQNLVQPILDLLEAVVQFFDEMARKIDEFVNMLLEGDAAKCALEIFEPVTDTVNLLTCPIDEAAGAFMHFVVDQLTFRLGDVMKVALNSGMKFAVDAIVPDGLEIYIPDFTLLFPANFWLEMCEDAAVVFPGLPETVSNINNLPLPYHMTGRDLEESILADALFETTIDWEEEMRRLNGYESACVEAYNEMGTDFEHCKNVLEDIENAAQEAACETAKLGHQINMGATNAALSAFNSANSHFRSAQSDFNSAKAHLNDVQGDLDGARRTLENQKSNCPNCRCGGCGTFPNVNFGCLAESAWCCPARGACIGGLEIAKVGVDTAKGTVTVAEGAVHQTSVVYNQAQRQLTHATSELNYYRSISDASGAAVQNECGGRRRVDTFDPQPAPVPERLNELEAPIA